jgi:hypothetical protein
MCVTNWCFTNDPQCVYGWAPEVMLGAAEFLRGLDLLLEREDFRALL